MSETHHLKLPLTESSVRSLRTGDMVYLDGEVVITAGLPTHQRISQYIDEGRPLPIDLSAGVLLHFGGYSHYVHDKLELSYLNPTTSTRFDPYMPKIIRKFGLRAVGGKGGLNDASAQAMQESGCVYLSFPGGACTLYSHAIRDVIAVGWKDLLLHYRLLKLRVEGLGPGTVAIDAHGNSLYSELQKEAAHRLPQIMAALNAGREKGSSK